MKRKNRIHRKILKGLIVTGLIVMAGTLESLDIGCLTFSETAEYWAGCIALIGISYLLLWRCDNAVKRTR